MLLSFWYLIFFAKIHIQILVQSMYFMRSENIYDRDFSWEQKRNLTPPLSRIVSPHIVKNQQKNWKWNWSYMSGHLLIFLGTRLVCKVWSTIYLPLDPATFPLYTLGAYKFHVSGKPNTLEFDCTIKPCTLHKKREFSPSFSI